MGLKHFLLTIVWKTWETSVQGKLNMISPHTGVSEHKYSCLLSNKFTCSFPQLTLSTLLWRVKTHLQDRNTLQPIPQVCRAHRQLFLPVHLHFPPHWPSGREMTSCWICAVFSSVTSHVHSRSDWEDRHCTMQRLDYILFLATLIDRAADVHLEDLPGSLTGW